MYSGYGKKTDKKTFTGATLDIELHSRKINVPEH